MTEENPCSTTEEIMTIAIGAVSVLLLASEILGLCRGRVNGIVSGLGWVAERVTGKRMTKETEDGKAPSVTADSFETAPQTPWANGAPEPPDLVLAPVQPPSVGPSGTPQTPS